MRVYIATAFAAILLFGSCNDGEQPASEVVEAPDNYMSFSTDVQHTRGESVTANSIKEMAVFCFYTEKNNWSEAAIPNRIYNLLVSRTGTDNWVTPVKWGGALGDQFSFFAYAPYARGMQDNIGNPEGNHLRIDATGEDADGVIIPKTGTPLLIYETRNLVEEQTDVLIATPVKDIRASADKVPLIFDHKLSKVGFTAYANVGGIAVTSIAISALQYKGTIKLDNKSVWNMASEVATFTLNFYGGMQVTSLNKDNPTNLCEPGNYFLLLPQTFTNNVTLIVDYTKNGADQPTKTVKLEQSTSDWKMANAYTYHLHLQAALSHELTIESVTIEPWVVKGTVDIETPKQ